MPCIVTTIHDPAAVAATCHRFQMATPEYASVGSGSNAIFGYLVRLPGLHSPIVVNILTGLLTYDRRDNGFGRYGRIMRFIHRIYHIQAERRLLGCRAG